MVVGLLGNESSDSNRFTLVTPKSENDVRLQATLGNQNTTGLPVGVVRRSWISMNRRKCMKKAMKYDKLVAEMELMSMLNESVVSANEEGWIDEDEMLKHFEKRFNND